MTKLSLWPFYSYNFFCCQVYRQLRYQEAILRAFAWYVNRRNLIFQLSYIIIIIMFTKNLSKTWVKTRQRSTVLQLASLFNKQFYYSKMIGIYSET